MKNYILLSLLFITVCGYAQNISRQGLNELIDDNNLPGIQIAYTANGKTSLYQAGLNRPNGDKKLTSHDLFRAGSLGKCVFAYAVLRLYDRGLIDLDKSLLNYIDNYNRFDNNDQRYRKITARMVLSHTSGLAEFSEMNEGKVKLLFEPGITFSYSGEGVWFLQKVVEHILNKPFEDIMQQEVFIPLGMNSSTYVQTNQMDSLSLGTISKDMAGMYPNAAFSLLTTAHDYNIFLQALLAGKGFKPATRQLMFTRQSDAQWAGHDSTAADTHIDWGLGIGLQQNEKGDAIWHWGSTDDFYSFFMAYPKKGQSFVFFTRGNRALKVTDQLVDMFMGKQTTWAMKWLHLGYDEPQTMAVLFDELRKHGTAKAPALFDVLKKRGYTFSERDLVNYGMSLTMQKHYAKAIAVLKQATKWYPENPVALGSLAATYEGAGYNKAALADYKLASGIDKENSSFINHIKSLEAGFTPADLKVFEGTFAQNGKPISFTFKATGSKLMLTQSWDGGVLEFFRTGELEFYNDEPGFSLKFTKDANGNIDKAFMNDIPVEWVKVKQGK
ncbi:hypothetical protein D0C36_08515 [Mucilaginibacter conchicola]|uniref:Beta-lactamase-related domain-containing protein n=1 Tax=Mucilaginibacter conchicola TaxID=2303333 RepID=A0A372P1D7_9SPHI|nr:serine hydrolase [Mucilaginibacter conchicola]RFZ95547.1 hypothetical protein D0C36_08515 [Mucilaginibacter conchicola]